MIIPKGMDVEIFPNLFSVTFVDLLDYLQKFSDCVDSKGKPLALTECLSVDEIKQRLDEVKTDIFYISDTDDSQLLKLLGYINNMRPTSVTRISSDGCEYEEWTRTDLYGFNNSGYDDYMIKYFMMYCHRCNSIKELITKLYEFSKHIISLQEDKDRLYNDTLVKLVRSCKVPYMTIDLQQVYGLNSASVVVDNSGNRNKFPKSLKQTSINLKWHELLDFTLPPIDEEEARLYWHKKDEYRGIELENLNRLITNDFDRYVLPKYVEPMLHYNRNDVFLCCEIVRQKPDEVKLRYSITNSFKINVLSSARSNISDKLLTDLYSKFSGLHKSKFEKLRTNRTRLSFNKIIFPHIQFKTKQLQDFLEDIKKVSIYHTTKDEFSREIEFYGTKYCIATGGIHSQDPPRVLKSDDKYIYRHHDYTSYYPSIMISYKIAPKHLNRDVVVKIVSYLKDTRVKCKHTPDSEGYIIDGVPNKIGAEALKIVINAIYGKLGSDIFFFYDRFAQMQVTINGQLMTMTLIEELELNGIHVVSANTDGIIIKLPRDKIDVYKDITNRWNEFNKMGADYEDYEILVDRDVNNYFDVQTDGSVEFKGSFDPKQYLKELKKGYDMPIVAKAVFEYFYHNIPVMDTLHNHKDILDFCKTQNVGRQFDVVFDVVKNGKIETIRSQRHVRFYVSYKGNIILKEEKSTKKRQKLAGGNNVTILNSLDDKPIEERAINYKYYYDECYKIIDPIMLGISNKTKADNLKGTASGKVLIKKYSHQYNSLFDLDDY